MHHFKKQYIAASHEHTQQITVHPSDKIGGFIFIGTAPGLCGEESLQEESLQRIFAIV